MSINKSRMNIKGVVRDKSTTVMNKWTGVSRGRRYGNVGINKPHSHGRLGEITDLARHICLSFAFLN